MNAVALLFVAAVAHLGPDVAMRIAGGLRAPWETVFYGIEAAALYLYALARVGALSRGEIAAVLYGVFESIQRPIWRAFLPMDAPTGLKPGQYMGDVVTGFPVSLLSPILLCLVVWVVVIDITKPTNVCSSNSRKGGA